MAHPLPRASLCQRLRRTRIDAGLCARGPGSRASDSVRTPLRDRNLHVGRAAPWIEDRSAGLDRAGVSVGVECTEMKFPVPSFQFPVAGIKPMTGNWRLATGN